MSRTIALLLFNFSKVLKVQFSFHNMQEYCKKNYEKLIALCK